MSKGMTTVVTKKGDDLEWVAFKPGRAGVVPAGSGVISPGGEGKATLHGSVIIGLTSEEVLLRVVDLPNVDKDELVSMAELQMDKMSPFPIENMVISCEALRSDEDMCRVLIAGVKKDIVTEIAGMFESTGQPAERVDVSLLAYWRLMSDAHELSGEGREVVMILSERASELMILQDGLPLAFRSFGEIAGLPEDQVADEMAGEVGHTLMSLELEHDVVKTSRARIWCEDEPPAGLIEALGEICGCEVETKQLSALPSLAEGLVRRAHGAEGLSMNLVPSEWLAIERSRQTKRKAFRIGGVILGAWLLVVAVIFGGVAYQKWSLGRLADEWQEKWEKPVGEVEAIMNRVETLRIYTDRSRSVLACLWEVSRLDPHPDQAIIWTEFMYRKNKSVTIKGEADNQGLVLQYIRNLNKSKLFEKVVPGDQVVRPRTGKVSFSIVMTLPGEEEE